MSYLFFIDESGHDHKNCPYEVRGGVVIHASSLWSFIQQFRDLEIASFGVELADYGIELKGSHLLEKKRFKWAAQGEVLDDVARRKHAQAFLNRGRTKTQQSEIEFRAFVQACIEMCRGVFRLLQAHDAKVFAAVVPRSTRKPGTFQAEEYLRKDQVYLLERYFNFVSSKNETGLLVFDETDRSADRSFIRQIERYFMKTAPGRFRATSIVPFPMFVSSDLTKAIQAADICIYALNWGFRVPRGMDAEIREEIAKEFSAWISTLQASGKTVDGEGTYPWYGVVYVPQPFGVIE
jgi:Protein of unknown function (DUF3800)